MIIEKKIYIDRAEKEELKDLREIFFNERRRNFHWMEEGSIKLEDFDSSTEGEVILSGKINGEIVGFASIWVEDKFIHNLFVTSEYKRVGVGKALLKSCEREVGLPLALKCVKENEDALKFYLSQGWTIQGEGEDYYLMRYEEERE